MDDTQRMAMAGIHTLERELIVRDFITVVNEGQLCDMQAFLTENVRYQPSARMVVEGREAVTTMLRDLKDAFESWSLSLVHVAVCGDTVLTEQRLDLALPGTRARCLTGFGSFRLVEFPIAAWHQVFA